MKMSVSLANNSNSLINSNVMQVVVQVDPMSTPLPLSLVMPASHPVPLALPLNLIVLLARILLCSTSNCVLIPVLCSILMSLVSALMSATPISAGVSLLFSYVLCSTSSFPGVSRNINYLN